MTYVLAVVVCGHEVNTTMANVQLCSTFCYTCRTKRGIIDIVTKEWYSYCYDCRHRRYYGANQAMAKEGAHNHWRKHNGHRASYAQGTRPKSVEAREFLIKRGIVTSCD